MKRIAAERIFADPLLSATTKVNVTGLPVPPGGVTETGWGGPATIVCVKTDEMLAA